MKTIKSLQRALIPDDENGEVLCRMFDDGDDLSLPREIDFHLVFGQEVQAQGFVLQAAQLPEVTVTAPDVDDEGVWMVTASRHMPASHAGITALEQQLALVAQAFDGYPDGWSCSIASTLDDDGDAEADPDAGAE